MGYRPLATKPQTIFKRKNVLLERREYLPQNERRSRPVAPALRSSANKTELEARPLVLIVNSSHKMASEITTQLTLQMPDCSLMYAPSFELARWILSRRPVDLIVSNALLPDGSIAQLEGQLRSMSNPPDVIVVGDMNLRSAEAFERSGYHFASIRRVAEKPSAPVAEEKNLERQRIKSLGADIRNDLNNPLQEIVAMAFVAQSSKGANAQLTGQALDAIESAAKNMSEVVNRLEQKILEVVEGA